MALIQNQYITNAQFRDVLEDLSYEASSTKQQELIDRATADLESDMSQRYVVPVVGENGDYSTAPQYARGKVLNAMKEKLREIIGYDKNKNLVGTIESTERFINVHTTQYDRMIKDLINPKIMYGFLMHDYTQDAINPIQKLALSRADDETSVGDFSNPRSGFGL